MESLGIDLRLIIAQIINFGLLLFLLTKFLYKPILKILDERKKKIAESLVSAQKIEAERAKIEEEKQKELERAKEAGREVMEEMKIEAGKQREETLKKAREEAEKIVQKAKEQLVLEKAKLQEELKAVAASLAITLAEKFLKGKIGREEREEFLKQSLEKLREKIPQRVSFSGLPTDESLGKRKISPQAAKLALEFLSFLKRTQNLKLLPEILGRLEEQIFIPAQVVIAAALKPEEQQKIVDTLEEIFGKGLKIKFRVEPKIVGGMIVKVGDKVFDNSLLGKTREFKEAI